MNMKKLGALIIGAVVVATSMFTALPAANAEAAAKSAAADNKILGKTTEKAYINEFFNIRIPIYHNSEVANDAELAAQNECDANGYNEDSRVSAINSGDTIVAQYIHNPKKDIYVMIGKFSSAEEKNEYMKHMNKNDLTNTLAIYKNDSSYTDVKGEIKKIDCLGKQRPVVMITGKCDGEDFMDVHLHYVQKDYHISYLISGLGTNQVELLEKAKRIKKQ
ncbi:hypothetical protein D6853_04680 [Butyrivibrio sp. X503]|uniref:hypothetical protein n=1 Tax=Butyrivibrio sp. X503 TaxID=2364878 RepID=UPI000EA855FE|nr:hypothetical protein [Butyrivibrio sp. X503]RKM57314.1 hypothetical protein D6853_04680 [Butyrivibrio sp. X503]